MLSPEYRVGFQALMKKIGLGSAMTVAITAYLRSLRIRYRVSEGADSAESTKTNLKNHFKLMAFLYKELERRYGTDEADQIMRMVILQGGDVYLRGFTPLGPNDGLLEFAEVYKEFERQNIIFDVIEKTDERFELKINRCLVYESFNELGVPGLTKWMCDVATSYFQTYHKNIKYKKGHMIARGDETCNEVFTWN
jgi:hypothetical protein